MLFYILHSLYSFFLDFVSGNDGDLALTVFNSQHNIRFIMDHLEWGEGPGLRHMCGPGSAVVHGHDCSFCIASEQTLKSERNGQIGNPGVMTKLSANWA